jgi:hypothetical protein
MFHFIHANDTFFYRCEERSGPDEFCGQYRQAKRDYNHRRPWQDDHGHPDNQDRETGHYYYQTPGLSVRSNDEMFHDTNPLSAPLNLTFPYYVGS